MKEFDRPVLHSILLVERCSNRLTVEKLTGRGSSALSSFKRLCFDRLETKSCPKNFDRRIPRRQLFAMCEWTEGVLAPWVRERSLSLSEQTGYSKTVLLSDLTCTKNVQPGSSKSWKFHVKSGDYQFFEGLSEKTLSFQTPGFWGKTPRH